jgi:excisionase family DNA binding protein
MAKIYLNELEIEDIRILFEQILDSKLESIIKQQNSERSDKLLTRKETAKVLRISLPTLNEWTKDGTISSCRIGGRVLYTQEAINESLNARKFKVYGS